MIDGRLNFDTKINTNGFSSGLKTLDGQMKGLQNTAVKLAGALAGAFSVKQVIEYAAEVKALNSQFEQTFGDLQDEAQAARTSASTAATKLVRMNFGFLLMSHTPTLLASHRTLNVPRYQQPIPAA